MSILIFVIIFFIMSLNFCYFFNEVCINLLLFLLLFVNLFFNYFLTLSFNKLLVNLLHPNLFLRFPSIPDLPLTHIKKRL